MTKAHTVGGNKEYILSCEKKATCEGLSFGFNAVIGRRSIHHQRRDLSFQCCSSDFCNYPAEFTTTMAPTTTTTVPTTPIPLPNLLKGCAKDIVFVLDGSSSIGQANHTYMRQFVQTIISGLQIGKNQSQIAMVEYSDTARVEWYLTEYSTLSELKQATNTIPYVSGTTATHAAFWLVRNAVLSPAHGDRGNAKDVVVVLTDGGTDIPSLAISEAQLLHDNGVEIVAIGIGNDADKQELSQLIQQNGNYFTVATFPTLSYIATAVKNILCT